MSVEQYQRTVNTLDKEIADLESGRSEIKAKLNGYLRELGLGEL